MSPCRRGLSTARIDDAIRPRYDSGWSLARDLVNTRGATRPPC